MLQVTNTGNYFPRATASLSFKQPQTAPNRMSQMATWVTSLGGSDKEDRNKANQSPSSGRIYFSDFNKMTITILVASHTPSLWQMTE